MIFRDYYFLLFLLIIPLILLNYFRKSGHSSVRFSTLKNLKKIRPSLFLKARHLLIFLRVLCITLLIIALARPQKGREERIVTSEGLDIMLVVDRSSSMAALDFSVDNKKMTRLDAVKDVVSDFIDGRKYDRIGLVVFSRYAYTQCPLTLDYGIIKQVLKDVEIVKMGGPEDGTAIGSAILKGVERLKNNSGQKDEGKGKVMILLTDGMNNFGKYNPATAAEAAKTFKLKIYTIGAGKKGYAPIELTDPLGQPIYQEMPVMIDEDTLKNVASTTGGQYFRATDRDSLKNIYKEIDKLEKIDIEEKYMDYDERFGPFVLLGLCCLVLEIIAANTRFRKIP